MTQQECSSLEELIQLMIKYHPESNIGMVEKAYRFAEQAHAEQKRKSGEPYFFHPRTVAGILASLMLDAPTIAAGLLHDTVEDCPDKTNLDEITKIFGSDVALLVDGVTKIKSINVEDKEEAQIESIRKMLLAMSKDIRVIFIKLCDRVHNMRTMSCRWDNLR